MNDTKRSITSDWDKYFDSLNKLAIMIYNALDLATTTKALGEKTGADPLDPEIKSTVETQEKLSDALDRITVAISQARG